MTQEHSKLYNYLSIFESESKRKLAMQNRRFDLLSPFLDMLSRTSYEGLHKQVCANRDMPILISCSSLNVLSYALSQISYELGECALSILELKLDKFRTRDGEVNEKLLKKAEIAKINDTCRLGLVMFAHFTCMYSPADRLQDRGGPAVVHSRKLLDGQPLHALVDMSCIEPDECKSYCYAAAIIYHSNL